MSSRASVKRPKDLQRAVAYVRVSKERDGMISPELQLDSIQQHCNRLGYTVVETLQDLDLSGRFWKRRQVEQAVGMIERHEAEVIVVWKVSRVARNRKDWAIAVDRVEGVGGRLESATEPMDTSTSSGRFARGMLAELAVFESERIGDTWKETHARRIKNGLPHSTAKRFGYTYVKGEGYQPDPVEAEVLRQMYLRFSRGETFHQIAAYARSEGFEPEAGWRSGTLRRLMDRGFGAGYLWVKGELIHGAHEGVISEHEWLEYRVRREARKDRPRAESTPYPFSGLLRCHCGAKMGGSFVRRGEKVYRRYLCLEAQQKGTHEQTSVSEPQVEKAVLKWLSTVAAEIDARTTVVPRRQSENLERKAAQITSELNKNAQRIDSLTVKYLDDQISAEVYQRLLPKLEDEKKALEARQRLLESNSTVRPDVAVPKLLEAWSTLPERGKREILSRLVAEIRLHDWENPEKTGFRKLTVVPVWE